MQCNRKRFGNDYLAFPRGVDENIFNREAECPKPASCRGTEDYRVELLRNMITSLTNRIA